MTICPITLIVEAGVPQGASPTLSTLQYPHKYLYHAVLLAGHAK